MQKTRKDLLCAHLVFSREELYCKSCIVRQKSKDFHLLSHDQTDGTSRPTYYWVLSDLSNFPGKQHSNVGILHVPQCPSPVPISAFPVPIYLLHLFTSQGGLHFKFVYFVSKRTMMTKYSGNIFPEDNLDFSTNHKSNPSPTQQAFTAINGRIAPIVIFPQKGVRHLDILFY